MAIKKGIDQANDGKGKPLQSQDNNPKPVGKKKQGPRAGRMVQVE